ncbi:MAG TPA: Arc family DNA-binding protein [Planctomycetota bacterium]|nr:Arc family DNA-binding protein [Planctomycetota bacterium]
MTDRKAFLLRLPQPMHDELRAWADQEMRSLNAQIEYLLREALVRRRGRSVSSSENPDKDPDVDPAAR